MFTVAIERLSSRNRRADSEHIHDRDFIERATRVAEVARRHADVVDTRGRFPEEAFRALREEKLLGITIPRELGGEDARISDLADICSILGAACASTGMIYAMHQVKVACLIRHVGDNPWQRDFQRKIARDQLLLASSTTEGKNGGAVRSSEAAIQYDGSRITLIRDTSVISYADHADAIVTTARRSNDAVHSDQALVVFEKSDYALDPTATWNTLGMRGTGSHGYVMSAAGRKDQIVSEPYERIHNLTMTPYAHILWSAVWLGVATDAFERARMCTRHISRKSGGQTPPAARRLVDARVKLEMLRGSLRDAIESFDESFWDTSIPPSSDSILSMNLLKVRSSELAVASVMESMRIAGLAGYRNDGEFSIGRALRDILSAPLMINNDRILSDAEPSVLMTASKVASRS